MEFMHSFHKLKSFNLHKNLGDRWYLLAGIMFFIGEETQVQID